MVLDGIPGTRAWPPLLLARLRHGLLLGTAPISCRGQLEVQPEGARLWHRVGPRIRSK